MSSFLAMKCNASQAFHDAPLVLLRTAFKSLMVLELAFTYAHTYTHKYTSAHMCAHLAKATFIKSCI